MAHLDSRDSITCLWRLARLLLPQVSGQVDWSEFTTLVVLSLNHISLLKWQHDFVTLVSPRGCDGPRSSWPSWRGMRKRPLLPSCRDSLHSYRSQSGRCVPICITASSMRSKKCCPQHARGRSFSCCLGGFLYKMPICHGLESVQQSLTDSGGINIPEN